MKPFENALSGFNHNIKHKGQLYHIQTEDSGKHNPTVTTLLFLGGNILASLKVSYAEHLESEALPKRVRELMETQHKQMLRNLMSGHYDKKHEAHSKHWNVGQLEEHPAEAAEHGAFVDSETESLLNAASLAGVASAVPSRPSRSLPREAQEQAQTSHLLSAGQVASQLSEGQTAAASGREGRRSNRPLPELSEEHTPAAYVFEDEEMGAVFGEDLISEKRLDELILNYLFREKDKLN